MDEQRRGLHRRLNARPRPFNDESPRGYLLRLTQANGFKSVSNLLYRLGYSGGVTKFRPESKAGSALLATLSDSLQYDATQLRQHFSHKAPQVDVNKQAKYSNSVLTSHARVCPLCIVDLNFVPKNWDYATTVVCSKHNVMMIDNCPECGQHLSFNRAHVAKSDCCRGELSTAPAVTIHVSAALLYSIKRVEARDMAFLAAWAAAIGRLQYPVTHGLPVPEITSLSVIEALPWVEAAAQLLCSAAARETYRQSLRDVRVDFLLVSTEAAELPFHVFQQEFGKHLIDLPRTDGDTLAELTLIGIPAVNDQPAEAIAAKPLSELLGCTISALSKLEKHGYLCAVSESKPLRFDVTPIIDVLRNIPLNKVLLDNHTHITLKKLLASKLYLRFGLRLEDILSSVFNGDIHVSKCQYTTPLAKLQVNKRVLYQALHRNWLHHSEMISVVRLAKALNVTNSDLVELRRHNMGWPDVGSRNIHPGEQLLAPHQWGTLRDDFIVLNRVCFFTGVKLNRAKKHLANDGLHASLEISTGAIPMLLFSRQDIRADVLLNKVKELSKHPTQYDGYRTSSV